MKNLIRAIIGVALCSACATYPTMARMWKPTPLLIAQDYTVINHNKGADGRVLVEWLASPGLTSPVLQQLLDKYVVLRIERTRQAPGGLTIWDDVQGYQVSDGDGQPLKELAGDAIPPTLVGMIAQGQATASQSTQGKAKVKFLVFETGAVNACRAGRLSIAYEGETYTYDTPIPGCAKP